MPYGLHLCRAPLRYSRHAQLTSVTLGAGTTFFRPPPIPSSTPIQRIHARPRDLQVHHSQFSPLTPPDPASLPKPRVRQPIKQRKWLRRLLILSALLGSTYALDKLFLYSSITRSMRTFKDGLIVALDYKINFRAKPLFGGSLEDLHARSARRVFDLLMTNGGLYLKIGQAIAMQSAILPPAFQKMFARVFDDAPQNSWKDVEKVIREEFGRSAGEVFGVGLQGEGGRDGKGVMERSARASASVAQVHWARLPDGREVAVKIQKREIKQQVGWDLWAFRVVARIYTWWFDINIYSLVPYISERLMLETDFENEATNSEDMATHVAAEPRLRNRVYIPKVYRELTSKRVMTAEWIEGVRLWDKEGITASWFGGWLEGTPGAGGAALAPPTEKEIRSAAVAPTTSPKDLNEERIKPERTSWRGPHRKGGLGVSYRDVMQTMVDLFSAQMFLWGVVHCDPHPGNILIRRLPSGKPELVLLDHGLYIRITPQFRHQYAAFWKALMTFDNKTISEITRQWGVSSPDIFASATLMRPYTGGDQSVNKELEESMGRKMTQDERAYQMQRQMQKGVKKLLADEAAFPRELIFIGRNLRIVQGNNQFLGSPVNRIKITGIWASRALAESSDLPLGERVRNWGRHIVFRFVLLGSDAVWWWARIRQVLGLGGGMEDELENQMRKVAKEFGVELNHGVFDG